MSTTRALAVLLVALALACSSPATVPPAPVAYPTAPQTSEAERAESAALPDCVMHAGVTEVETTERGGPGGKKIEAIERKSSCYYNAECFRQHGIMTPGDGIVRLHCEDHACVCRIEFVPPREAVHEFSFESACETNDQAEQLLKERCIPARRLPEAAAPMKH